MTGWITEIVERFSYLGVAFLMFVENVFPPIPSEAIMPLAGYVSAGGDLTFVGVVLAGTLGSALGGLPLYGVGRWVDAARLRRWIERHGHWLALETRDLDRAEQWFRRHGTKTVLLCRLVPGVRSLISVPAGLAAMPLGSFLLYSLLGSAVWTTALAGAGHALGSQHEKVEKFLGPAGAIVLGGLAVGFVVRVIHLRRKVQRAA